MAMMKAMEKMTVPEQKRKATPPLLEKTDGVGHPYHYYRKKIRNNFQRNPHSSVQQQNNPRSGQLVMDYGGDGSLPSFVSHPL